MTGERTEAPDRAATTPSRRSRLFVVVGLAVAAAIVRGIPLLLPGQITGVREYDDGVMLGGAMAMLTGRAPYADFIYVHPPGSLLMLIPQAATAGLWGEPGAMAFARIVAILIGAANAALIAVLLARRGRTAMIVGGGLYAAWPVVVSTERTAMLEPVLILGLLIALLLVRRRTAGAGIAAGAVLGLTTTVKVWAIIDVLVVGVMVAAMLGAAVALRYALAAAAAITAVCLPFFLIDPGAMWNQVIVAQVVRAGSPAPMSTRMGTMSLAQGVHALDHRIPWQLWLVVLGILTVIALVPLAREILRRTPMSRWSQGAWWAVVLLAHGLVIFLSRGYFYHYAVWVIGPLCLGVGYAAGWLTRRAWRVAAVVGVSGVLALTAIGGVRHPGEPLPGADVVTEWATTRSCVLADASTLIAVDTLRRNLANDCEWDIDFIGAALALDQEHSRQTQYYTSSEVWRARQWDFIAGADGMIVMGEGLPAWFTPEQLAEFRRDFVRSDVIDLPALWERRTTG